MNTKSHMLKNSLLGSGFFTTKTPGPTHITFATTHFACDAGAGECCCSVVVGCCVAVFFLVVCCVIFSLCGLLLCCCYCCCCCCYVVASSSSSGPSLFLSRCCCCCCFCSCPSVTSAWCPSVVHVLCPSVVSMPVSVHQQPCLTCPLSLSQLSAVLFMADCCVGILFPCRSRFFYS